MPDRHFHFNLISALWFFAFMVVLVNAMKFALNKWEVPGLTELVNNL
jgi:hypothetical protein